MENTNNTNNTNCCECAIKIFIFILILGPIIIVTVVLGIIALIYNFCVLLYFVIIGWSCELGFINYHGQFLIVKLICPWFILIRFYRKILFYFSEPLIRAPSIHEEEKYEPPEPPEPPKLPKQRKPRKKKKLDYMDYNEEYT